MPLLSSYVLLVSTATMTVSTTTNLSNRLAQLALIHQHEASLAFQHASVAHKATIVLLGLSFPEAVLQVLTALLEHRLTNSINALLDIT